MICKIKCKVHVREKIDINGILSSTVENKIDEMDKFIDINKCT